MTIAKTTYRPEIDGLRALAILPVILFHAGISGFSGGYIGVDVFFVISGFLITSILYTEINLGTYSLVRFYERRARRILPALTVMVLWCVPAAVHWMAPFQLADFGRSVWGTITMLANVALWRQAGYFEGAAELKPLLHMWSLSVEEQYYLLFPLGLFAMRKLSWLVRIGLISFALIASFGIAEWAWWNYPTANFFLTPTRAWELMSGSLLALLLAQYNSVKPEQHKLHQLGSIAGLAMVLAAIGFYDSHTPFPSHFTLLPVLGSMLLISFAHPSTWVGRLLCLRPLVQIGLISYSAYLWHQPLFAFARLALSTPAGSHLPTAWGVSLSALTMALAYATWRWIETPFRNSKQIPTQRIWRLSALALLAMAAAGWWTWQDQGQVSRYPKADRALMSLNPDAMKWYANRIAPSLELAPYRQNGQPKIFVLGDSYSRDFINALDEVGVLQHVSLSTHYKRKECGMALSAKDYSMHLDPSVRLLCSKQDGIHNPDLALRVKEADEVLVMASWRDWEVDWLPNTLQTLREMGAKRIWVLTAKNFGEIEPLKLVNVPAPSRPTLQHLTTESYQRILQRMRKEVDKNQLIDLHQLLCGNGMSCPVFTAQSELISFDGGHLTPEGSRWMGQRLLAHPLFGAWQQAPPSARNTP